MDTNNSGHKIIDLKNRIEASVAIWRPAISLEKREVFEERGETVLIILRQRFPGIHQSALDISKVQYKEREHLLAIPSMDPEILPIWAILPDFMEWNGTDQGEMEEKHKDESCHGAQNEGIWDWLMEETVLDGLLYLKQLAYEKVQYRYQWVGGSRRDGGFYETRPLEVQ
ncbi:hypothetical protein SAY86_014402 [Trapa natans]|uniref:PRONE domain-containing protein n=1 Tax=Trapa natans TaxID=22666 RepID=A0AAN7L161_TRANT|nr:hypothetical protein SAY86_014402 [Trapa natans]